MSKVSKSTAQFSAPEEEAFGRLIDVQVWKTMDKFGKVKKNSGVVSATGDAVISSSTSVSGEGEAEAKESPKLPSKSFNVSRANISKLIGPKGSTVKKFEEHFSVRISQSSDSKDAKEGYGQLISVTVNGESAESVQNAIAAIKQFFLTDVAPWSEEQLLTVTFDVPPRSAREILGEQGRVKAAIGRSTRTVILVPTVQERDLDSPTPVTIKISGRSEADAEKAKGIMEEIVMYHCSALTHPHLSYLQMDVPVKYHGRILGTRGATIRQLETEHSVRVYLPTGAQTMVVVVGDNTDRVANCMDAIEDIMDDFDKKEAVRQEQEAVKAAAKAAAKAAKAEAKKAAAEAAAASAAPASEEDAANE